MYKVMLGIIFSALVGCANSPNAIQENMDNPEKVLKEELTDVTIKVYEINDKNFNLYTTDSKDKFIENVTSHITEIDIDTALNKMQHNIKNVFNFDLKDNIKRTVGDESINDDQNKIGMIVVVEKTDDLLVFNVFNRVYIGSGYANSLSEITMNLSPHLGNKNEIAYRISENEIIHIKISQKE